MLFIIISFYFLFNTIRFKKQNIKIHQKVAKLLFIITTHL